MSDQSLQSCGKKDIEEGTAFRPKFDKKGLIPCIATSVKTGKVLMFAWMNAESLQLTLKTGQAHYWSRSRGEIWRKGASSGHTQTIREIRVDCDQDCLWISVSMPEGSAESACHTGRESCFYRAVPLGADSLRAVRLIFKDDTIR